ncbi:MAG: UbiA prenyltransferase family protein [Rhodospirillales bacterium]|nr:UbiA prenyltransferase family protein [Rhodospirillales bacterium]
MTSTLSALIRLARPRHWVKNAFVAAPLFFTPEAINRQSVGQVALAIAVFCLLSSAVYAINDWRDCAADRLHPVKRTRPLPAGELSVAAALVFAFVLLVAAGALSLAALPPAFIALAFAYAAANILYSLWLKHVAILDVLLIATGFVLRIDAGAAAVGIHPTVWIIVCTGLLALFLGLAKRRDDLVRAMSETHRPSLKGYNQRFIDASLAMVLGALLVSYIIYTTDAALIAKFGTDKLYLTTPFVIAGVLRYLQITLVEERSGSPTDIALGDRFMIVAVLGWIATFAILIYGWR